MRSEPHSGAPASDASAPPSWQRFHLRHPQDILFGLFLLGLAALGYFGGRGLSPGTTMRMGPGYVPMALSAIVAAMAVVMLLRAFFGSGERMEAWAWSKMAWILGSFLAFALTLERLGLVLSVMLVVVVSSLAAPDRRWWEIGLFAILGPAFCAVLFKIMLGIPVKLWPL